MQSPYPYPAPQQAPAHVDPIISRLRPRDVAGIIDQSVKLYRKHFRTFLAITAVVYVPVEIITQTISIFYQGTTSSFQRSSTTFGTNPFQSTTARENLTLSVLLLVALLLVTFLGTL